MLFRSGAKKVAERLRRGVENLAIPHEYSPVADHVTVSVGVACIVPEQPLQPAKFFDHVDQQLYRAKDNGRNRVFYADD